MILVQEISFPELKQRNVDYYCIMEKQNNQNSEENEEGLLSK